MSQNPNPQPGSFPPPPMGIPPLNDMNYQTGPVPPNPMASARRASLLMFILGALVVVMGLCMGTFAFLPMEQLAAQGGQRLPPLPPGMNWKIVAGVFGVLFIFGGVLQLVIAGFLRRGTTTPIVLGIVVSGLILIYLVLNTLYAMTRGQASAGAINGIIIAVYGLQVYFLIQALRAIPYLRKMQAAYQAQYWQYMQQQQAYQAGNPPAGGSIYNQTAYNAPPAVPIQPAQSQTGWQWAAPPPPPPLAPQPQNPPDTGGAYGQGPQQ